MPPAVNVPEWDQALLAALEDSSLVSLVLSGLHGGGDQPARYDVRPVTLTAGPRLQWTHRRGRQELHENLTAEESLARMEQWLGPRYRHAVLQTTTDEFSLRITKRGKRQLTRRALVSSVPLPAAAHNRVRHYILPEGTACPFLTAIGVMTADGHVRSAQQHKFRQINRYLEFIRDVLPDLPAEGTLQVVDCGCGKSGLTFALQHYLTQIARRDVQLTGLDWNAEVIEQCRATALRLKLAGLEFHAGNIAEYQTITPPQLVISLHACDTATDAALAQAIRWGADVILAVPCCQHELAPQLNSAPLQALLRHGILRERLAADATDALRAALLEVHGYRTQVLEFIELEHTPKNLLLRAVRRKEPLPADIAEGYRHAYTALKTALGVTSFALERLLEVDRPA